MRGIDGEPTPPRSSQADALSVLVMAGAPAHVEQVSRSPESAGYHVDRVGGCRRGGGAAQAAGVRPGGLGRRPSGEQQSLPAAASYRTTGHLSSSSSPATTSTPSSLFDGEGGLRHQALPDDRDRGAGPGPAARPAPRSTFGQAPLRKPGPGRRAMQRPARRQTTRPHPRRVPAPAPPAGQRAAGAVEGTDSGERKHDDNRLPGPGGTHHAGRGGANASARFVAAAP